MKLPYGYVLVGEEIVIHEERADVVRSIFDHIHQGHAGHRRFSHAGHHHRVHHAYQHHEDLLNDKRTQELF